MSASRRFLLALVIVIFSTRGATAQPQDEGEFVRYTHIGNPEKYGTIAYDAGQQFYTLEGASGNMWGEKDDFHFLWKRLKGDFILQATLEFVGTNPERHRKAGWLVRHSLEANSPHINAVVHGDGLTALQFRKHPGGITEHLVSKDSSANVLQLERRDGTYIMSSARYGEPFSILQMSDLSLGDDVYVGLFVCSHNESFTEKVIFKNVRIIIPAKQNFVPYRDYIGSHIEVMDVNNGDRKILYSEPGSLQAPNWTPDGKSLIYNRDGLLYSLDLKTNSPTVINTGFGNKNNNDHVLSFDGKMLGISHHSESDHGNSVVYVLPATGGTPQKVTSKSPSYLHGWSPDGKWLTYTGGRSNEYDIYKISVKGGDEIRLTDSKGLDDGPEYSPNGKYIYFNSVRSGNMQIWRMTADGKRQEQVTHDNFNNWFPHFSPDGKWIVMLSYQNDVQPADHPFYKHVYIRVMPANGGNPKVIAYVYGGQGTINVPSWSPDGKKIAFVSNSVLK